MNKKLDLYVDGIEGEEVAWDRVPTGNEAFQYALGKLVFDGEVAIFRRNGKERGTYGGWRWEGYANRLRPEPEPVSEPDPDQRFWFFERIDWVKTLVDEIEQRGK